MTRGMQSGRDIVASASRRGDALPHRNWQLAQIWARCEHQGQTRRYPCLHRQQPAPSRAGTGAQCCSGKSSRS